MSADGRVVAFASSATDLVDGDDNNKRDIFVRDRQQNVTSRISIGLNNAWADGDSDYPVISANGRYVAFSSNASNLVTGDTNQGNDIFVYDRQTTIMHRVSVNSNWAQGTWTIAGGYYATSEILQPVAMTPDGQYVAFGSYWNNLDTSNADTNGTIDVFVRDRLSNTTTRASLPHFSTTTANGSSWLPEISNDGRYVSFVSTATNLNGTTDTNGSPDIYIREPAASRTYRVSLNSTGNQIAQGVYATHFAMSGDAQYFAFTSVDPNVVPLDNNGAADVFFRAQLGLTTRVSRDPAGLDANGGSSVTSMSDDGRYIAYYSAASNIEAAGVDTNAKVDAFVFDQLTSTSKRVSLRNGQYEVNNNNAAVALSPNGRYVAMASDASNFVDAGDTNNVSDIYFVDRGAATGTTDLATSLVGLEAQSDQMGLEQFMPYSKQELGGSGVGYTNLSSGNFVAQYTDAVIPGQGLNTVIRRTYNSKARNDDNGLGLGWTLSMSDVDAGLDGLANTLTDAGSLIDVDVSRPIKVGSFGSIVSGLFQATGMVLELTDGDGTTHRFIRKGGPCGRWDSPPGVSLRVREEYHETFGFLKAYELIRPDGVTYRVEPRVWNLGVTAPTDCQGGYPIPSWQVTKITDRHNNELRLCYRAYGPLGKLRLRSVFHNRVSQSTTPIVRFDYTATGDLDTIVTLPGYSAADPATGSTRSWERWTDLNVDPVTRQLNSVVENAHALPTGALDGTRTTSFTYDPSTKALATIVDGRTNTTSLTFTNDRLTQLTDRRNKNWAWSYNTSPGTPSLVTVATAPVASGVSSSLTYELSPRGPISTGDKRIAGGNVTRITDAGHGPSATPVVNSYEWQENRLITSINGANATTRMKYNDLGLVTEVTEPPTNDSSRTDLPTGAPTTSIVSKLYYEWAPNQPTYNGCTEPTDNPDVSVSSAGRCKFIADLKRTEFATNVPGQLRIMDFQFKPSGNGDLMFAIERATPNSSTPSETAPLAGDRVTAFDYYDSGALKSVDGPRNDVVDKTYFGTTTDQAYGAYDRTGLATTVLDAASKTKTYGYTPYGLTAKVTDRDNRVTKSRYDERNNLREVTDPATRRTDYQYDQNDNKTKETSARGTVTATVDDFTNVYTYDANDWLTQVSEPGVTQGAQPLTNPTSPRIVNSTSYNDDGSKFTETGPRNNATTQSDVTTYDYWPNRLLKSVKAPATSTLAGDGKTKKALTEYFYDNTGRLNKTVYPVVNVAGDRPETLVAYTPNGDVSVQTETSAVAATARVTRYAYNAHSENIQTAGPRTVNGVEAQTTSVLDTFGQLKQSIQRLTATKNLTTSYDYDAAGNQFRVIQPSGDGNSQTSEYAFDALNRMRSQTIDPSNTNHTVDYTYNGEGQQLTRTDKLSGVATRKSTYEYNDDNTQRSLVVTQYDASGNATETLSSCNWASGSGSSTGYDEDGNLKVTRTLTGNGTAGCNATTTLRTQTFDYFDTGWLSSSTQTVRSPVSGSNVSRTENFTYELDESRKSVDHNGAITTYDHSAAGFNEKVTDWRSRVSTMDYVDSGAPITQKLNNDAIRGTIDYQKDGSPKSVTWSKVTTPGNYTSVRSHTGITYDVGGLRTQETINVVQPTGSNSPTGGTANLSHDLVDRLSSYESPYTDPTNGKPTTNYGLDDAGTILTETVTAGGQQRSKTTTALVGNTNRLDTRTIERQGLPTEVVSFTYTGLGEEETKVATPSTTTSENTKTTYDPAGHVRRVDDRRAAAANPVDVDYVYDTADRVISRVETPNTGTALVTLYFYWGTGGSLAEETDGAGNTMVRYLLDGNDEHIAQESWRNESGTRDTSSTWSWLLPDSSGNTATQLSDDGTVTEQAAFDPYGKPDAGGGSSKATGAKPTTMGFQGAITDKTTRGVILGARIYDPATARFTTPDTFVAGQLDMQLGTDALTGNRYLFAAANPTAFFDDGHWGLPKIKIKIPSPARILKTAAKIAVPALGFVPVVGTTIDVISAATGRDLLNGGKKLSGAERLILLGGAALSIATSGAGTSALKGIRAAAKAADSAGEVRAAAKVVAGAQKASRAARLARATDTIVLGKYPKYTRLAEEIGARTFNIPTKVWDSLSVAERWAANQKFLDRAIRRGSAIELATSALKRKNLTGYFGTEIKYLLSKGYSVSSDGMRMLPPPK